jgi:cytochrome c553
VPACIACHGPRGEGLPSAGYPAIAGQHPEYTIAQLKAFRDGARHNDPNGMMRGATHLMSDKQMEAVAHYLVGLH